MTRDPSPAEISAEIARIESIRAARVAAQSTPDASPQAVPLTVEAMGDRTPRFSEEETAALVAEWRAGYVRYADNPEIIKLMEEKLSGALKADGITAPPLTAEDRLKMLRLRHASTSGA